MNIFSKYIVISSFLMFGLIMGNTACSTSAKGKGGLDKRIKQQNKKKKKKGDTTCPKIDC